ILLALLSAHAQPPAPAAAAVPPADHPDLYYAFFMNGPAPDSVPINNADKANFRQVSAAVVSDLNKLEGQRQKYLALVNARGKKADPATLMGFDGASTVAVLGGLNKLRKGLSPKGWHDFHDWVNGPFRQSLGGH